MARTGRASLGLLGLALMGLLAGCATPAIPVAGLRPDYPEARHYFVKVDTLRPTLRWESFPRPWDVLLGATGRPAGAGDITYDLRIWRAEPDSLSYRPYPTELVYSRQGLPAPVHTVETPLEPATNYLWTVRARFTLDGHPRVLEWGVIASPFPESSPRTARIPHPEHYRFRTPD